jgi:hypothetical protein
MHATLRHAKKKFDPFIAGPLRSLHTRAGLGLRYWSNDPDPASLFITLHNNLITSPKSYPAYCPTSTTRDRRVSSHHIMSTCTKQPRSRFKNFLSSAFDCFTGPRSKAYHPISDHSSSARKIPTSSRQSDPAQITPTFPDQPVPSPTNSSSQRCSTEAPHKVVAQTKPPTSVDPEFDVIDGTYLCRMTRYPDDKEKWLPDIELKPNQAFRACVDPTVGNCLTFLPPSQNPPTLESASRLIPTRMECVSRKRILNTGLLAPTPKRTGHSTSPLRWSPIVMAMCGRSRKALFARPRTVW